jgi:hypothetical protein
VLTCQTKSCSISAHFGDLLAATDEPVRRSGVG